MGFSSRMAQPASAAGMATSKCSAVGLATITASRFVLFQRFGQIRFNGIARQFVIRQGGFVGAIENNILLAQGNQIAKMAASDGAETSN